jgi:hypothetical protein
MVHSKKAKKQVNFDNLEILILEGVCAALGGKQWEQRG